MADCIDVMAQAMQAVSSGAVLMPQRLITPVADSATVLGLMPSSAAELPVYAVKVLSLSPSNPARGLPAVQGLVLLFSRDSHAPVAVLDGAAITALRTAAVSGLATRALARPDAATLGIMGTGRQVALHIDAVHAVRPLTRVLVWGRDAAKAERVAVEQAARTGLPITAVADARDAAACDIVCTLTSAGEPIVHGAWVQPGAHLNLVGTHTLDTREADAELLARATVVVDHRLALAHEGGNVRLAEQEGVLDPAAVYGELGEVLAGSAAGRAGRDDITVFVSHGIAAQDLYTADAIYRSARAERLRQT